jgi:hypothetical protein
MQKCSDILYERRIKAGLNQNCLEKFAKVQQKKYHHFLSSLQVQKEADRVWEGVEKVLFSTGKKIKMKRYHQIDTISQKNHSNGIIFRKADRTIRYMDYIIPVIVEEGDEYAEQALKDRIKYVELKRMEFETGYRYYVILYLEGEAPLKDKNIHNEAETGIDIGVSTVAMTSDYEVLLEELAPDSRAYEHKIGNLQRKAEYQKRRDNPDNYNEDGTYKKGKHKWILSEKCRKYQRQIRILYRKQTAYIYTSHHNLANRIIRNAGSVVTEQMNWKALAKRSKNTERLEKESEVKAKDGTIKTVHKYKRKKRFGRSVKNRSPGLFQKTIKAKCIQQDIPYFEVDTKAFRASQYNHMTGECIKTSMSQRTKTIDGHKVQRDLYSAWLLKNTGARLDAPDRKKCLKTFEAFLKMHDREIACMKYYGKTFRQCFGF